MGGEGVTEQVRVDALRIEAGLLRQPAQDEERTGAGQPAALGVQEQLRPVPAVEVRASACEVAAERLGRRAADGDEALLRALAGRADDPLLEVDVGLAEPDRLA